MRAIANFTGIEGSRPRFARPVQSMLITGANSTIQIGLKFWVCGAEIVNSPKTLLSVFRSAKSVSDEPACSNNVQKKTLKTISTMAAHIIWNSVRVPLEYDQINIAGTAIRNEPKSSFPMSERDMM